MSIKGSPHARFRRALGTRNPALVLAAAAELPRIALVDALAICLILLDGGSNRYDRAVVRWHARFCLEVPRIGSREAAFCLAALLALPSEDGVAAAEGLRVLFAGRDRDDLARVIGAWAARSD